MFVVRSSHKVQQNMGCQTVVQGVKAGNAQIIQLDNGERRSAGKSLALRFTNRFFLRCAERLRYLLDS